MRSHCSAPRSVVVPDGVRGSAAGAVLLLLGLPRAKRLVVATGLVLRPTGALHRSAPGSCVVTGRVTGGDFPGGYEAWQAANPGEPLDVFVADWGATWTPDPSPVAPGPSAGAGFPDQAGDVLLDELAGALSRYVVLPTTYARDAVTLWITATHVLPAFDHAPRLVVNSPEKRCGKSRLLDIIEATAHEALVTVNATSAAIFRRIGDGHPPTLLIDEADSIFGTKKAAEANEDLRALVNAGHQRNRPALRCVGPQQTPTEFATFAMVALAGIGTSMPDTITDRAVNITMRRRAPGEHISAFRHRRDATPLHALRDRLQRWAAEVAQVLETADPPMPVEDRAADTWAPLVAVADAAGGTWPARARTAAVAMVKAADGDQAEVSLGVRLLADCRDVFTDPENGAAELASEELVRRLREVAEAPWSAFELDQRGLARRLRGYGVRPDRLRPGGGSQVRGYRVQDFADAFSRYLLDDAAPNASRTVTPSFLQVIPVTDNCSVTDATVTDAGTVTGAQAADLLEHRSCDGVTDGDATAAANGAGPPFPRRDEFDEALAVLAAPGLLPGGAA